MFVMLRQYCFTSLSFVLLFIPSGSVAWQLSFPQDTIAYNSLFNNRQSVAFDSHGRLHAVYSGSQGTNSASREIFYATESGDSFMTIPVTTNAVDDNYPTISVDRNDNIHVGFEGRDAGNLFQVQYSRLVNGAFTPPMYITQGGINKATPYSAIGRDSVVHFVYNTYPTTGTQYVYYRKYDLRDSTLSVEQQLTDAGVTGDFDAAIAADTSGYVHIVVKSGSAFGGPMKYYTNRTGLLVETPTSVSDAVDYPRVIVDRRNVVHILYRNSSTEVLYVVDNASGSFGTPVPVTPAGQRPAGYHNFAVDDQHRVYVVYQSSVSTSGKGWYLVHGKDKVFSDTTLVFDLPPTYLTRNTSAVAARGNGEVAVTYSPGASRGGLIVCDVFMKRGFLFPQPVETTAVIPPEYAGTPGTATFIGPLAASQRVYQLLIHDTLLTGHVGKRLKAISWRIPPSATGNWPTADVTFSNYDIYLSGSVAPSNRSLTFAQNVVGPQTQVRSGSLTIPMDSYPSGGSPNGWGPEITFTPWRYSGGHLLVELRHVGFTGTTRSTDAVSTTASGYGSLFSAAWGNSYTATTGLQGNFSVVRLTLDDSTVVGINEDEVQVPAAFALYQNYPNPFNPETNIRFALPASGHVILAIYDLLGRKVTTLVDEVWSAGVHRISFDAAGLSSGVYFYRLNTSGFVQTRKLMLLR